ncbi:hypothetical protein EI546_11340 [Aequorivita sp. H23M31]|uniref:Uncharacterized protein n=1 Tax=Aequorivita ciconiae TaxID=2494375 RepID=A0A410G4V0_9FLAO|nr:hypothetical protein [Aequorivita sp. H23M31]QAA82276.1 hypothetical protein EI546_11340 [Aequorivita sp. H23M31]
MKKPALFLGILFSLSIFSCKKDEAVTCITCSSPDTLSFELCQEGDGNASVNGDNTGTPYDTYLSGLQESGVQCGAVN